MLATFQQHCISRQAAGSNIFFVDPAEILSEYIAVTDFQLQSADPADRIFLPLHYLSENKRTIFKFEFDESLRPEIAQPICHDYPDKGKGHDQYDCQGGSGCQNIWLSCFPEQFHIWPSLVAPVFFSEPLAHQFSNSVDDKGKNEQQHCREKQHPIE